MTRRTRLAIIGLGGISQIVHLPLIRRLDENIELVAVVDLSLQRAERAAGSVGSHVLALSSLSELVRAIEERRVEVDGAILATSGAHSADVATLVRAGVRVLAEKPLGYSRAEIRALVEVATELEIDIDRWVRVGYMKEHDPAVARARQILARCRPRAVHVEVLHPADIAQTAFAKLWPAPHDVDQEALRAAVAVTEQSIGQAVGRLPDEFQRYYSDLILGSIVHDISLLRHLLGGIDEVAHARHWPEATFPGSFHFAGSLREHKAPWFLDWHFIPEYPEYRESVTVHHEHGTIRLVFGVPYVLNLPTRLEVLTRQESGAVESTLLTWPQDEAFEAEILQLVALCRDEEAAGATVADALADLQVAQRMVGALAGLQDWDEGSPGADG